MSNLFDKNMRRMQCVSPVSMQKTVAKNNIIIIGVGNILRRDDGIGSIIIEELENLKLENVDLLDGGTDGLALLDYLSNYSQAIIIDAVSMGTLPGTVKVFTPQEVSINIQSDALSTHGLGLAEVMKLMEPLEIKTNLTIIGIEPKDISFGEGLSVEIQAKIPEILAGVRHAIRQFFLNLT
jgi:hydrogenase maturation protease